MTENGCKINWIKFFGIFVVDNYFKLADGDLSDEAFKHELINAMLMSPSIDKYNHHLNKNYDWMDDYMI